MYFALYHKRVFLELDIFMLLVSSTTLLAVLVYIK